MADTADTISEVETKTLPSGAVLYEIKDSKGTVYTTKDREIAKQAYGLISTSGIARIQFTEKKGGQFGQFTDRWINGFQIEGGTGNGTDTTGDPWQQEIPTQAGPDPFADTEPEPAIGRDRDAETALRIQKCVALEQAVESRDVLDPPDRTAANITSMAEVYLHWLLRYQP